MKCFFILLTAAAIATSTVADWKYPFYLDGDRPFKQRIRIAVTNDSEKAVSGEALHLPARLLPLTGEDPLKIRVVDSQGRELLHRIQPESKTIAEESELIIPVTVDAKGESVVWIYYDNPAAWQLPDSLPSDSLSFSDSFETGISRIPPGWSENMTDDLHKNLRSTSIARTGKRSLETRLLPGAKPNWVKFFREIPVRPGMKYRISGWVKGENISGGSGAGFFLHIGSRGNTAKNPVNRLGNYGSFDWKKLEFEGVVPEGADLMVFGTALHANAGCAWYDDIDLQLSAPDTLKYQIGKPEILTLISAKKTDCWELDARKWPERYTFCVYNFSSQPDGMRLCALPVNRLTRGNYPASDFRLLSGGREVPFLLIGGKLIFEVAALPESAGCSFHLYLAAGRKNRKLAAKLTQASSILSDYQADLPDDINRKAYEKLVFSKANLLKNPSFEGMDGWNGGGERKDNGTPVTRLVPGGLFGAKKALLEIPPDAPSDWYGFRQAVSARQGRDYLVAGFVESDSSAEVWVHEFSRNKPEVFANETGLAAGSGWKPFSMLVTALHPDSMIEVHLTSPHGRRAYDGMIVAEIAPFSDLAFECAADREELFRVWQVNPIVKIFEESTPETAPELFRMALARNEAEGLQLGVRSSRAFPSLAVRAGAAKNEQDETLPPPAVGIVENVRLDAESRYFQFTGLPSWQRCVPGGSRGELYPDPILPGNEFHLEKNKTRGLYLKIYAPHSATPGVYRGEITFLEGERVVQSLPYEVTVWNFTLPDRPEISAIFDSRFETGRKFKDYTEMEAAAFLAKSRLSFDEIPARPAFRLENNVVKADFTEFDKGAELWFDQWNVPLAYLPLFREHFGWGHPPKSFLGIAPYAGQYPYRDVDRGELTPEYRRVCQAALRLMMDHLREKGWADRFLLYIADEPHANEPGVKEQMIALCDMIHEVEPDLRIYSSTWRMVPEWLGKLNVWGIGAQGQVSEDDMKKIRESGAALMITTDGQLCLDTPFNALERLLPLYAWKYGTLGYEFWGADWLTRDPYQWGIHKVHTQSEVPGRPVRIRYPNGDGYLFYPGNGTTGGPVSSLRLESHRDGIEDYSYFVLLEKLVDETNDAEAATLLKRLKELASIPNPGGRKSELLLPDPDSFTALRQAAGEKISRGNR